MLGGPAGVGAWWRGKMPADNGGLTIGRRDNLRLTHATTLSSLGITASIGSIVTNVSIYETSMGGIFGNAWGTLYPNAEVWVYGEPEGSVQMLNFQTAEQEPSRGLQAYGSLGGFGRFEDPFGFGG